MKSYLYALILFTAAIVVAGCHRQTSGSGKSDSAQIVALTALQDSGQTLRNRSDFEAAIALHDSCIKIAQQLGDTCQMVIAYNHQATNYRRFGNMKEASELHYKALELCDAYSDKTSFTAQKNVVRTLNGLGNVLLSLGNYEAAEAIFRRALDGEERLESATGQAINLANIGSIKEKTGLRDSAYIYYNRSMQKNREANNAVGISLCYGFLGNLAHKSGDNASALTNYRQALTIGRATGDTWHWLEPCISLGNIYLANGQTDSAAYYIGMGVEAAHQINSLEHLVQLYALHSKLSERRGNAAVALNSLKQSQEYADSLKTQQDQSHVQNLRINYESHRREADVRRAEEQAAFDKRIRNVVLIAASIVMLLIAFAGYISKRSYNARRNAIKERELFYRNVTHQLRTPLTVVLGMMQQLRHNIPDTDNVALDNLQAAQRQGRNLLELIQKLIAASRQGVLNDVKMTDVGAPSFPESVSLQQVPAAADFTTKSVKTVLVAEDDDDVALLICNIFSSNGYMVVRSADGQEALEQLRDDLPDLLVTDIAMPRMDGIELMKHVREDDTMSHLPVIVVSARVEFDERLEGIDAGAEVYLAKPFDPDELLLRARTILEQRERLRRRYSMIATGTNATADATTGTDSEDTKSIDLDAEFLCQLNDNISAYMATEKVDSTFLAGKMCMSRSQLNRKVKNLTGMSSTLYIRARRMAVAHDLLSDPTLLVSEIEYKCGFDTPGYFSRTFKATYGLSPSEYRKSLGHDAEAEPQKD